MRNIEQLASDVKTLYRELSDRAITPRSDQVVELAKVVAMQNMADALEHVSSSLDAFHNIEQVGDGIGVSIEKLGTSIERAADEIGRQMA